MNVLERSRNIDYDDCQFFASTVWFSSNYTETSFFRVKELKTHLFALPKTYCEVINYP